MEKINISIGICAYNEEKNIGFLLKRLLSQKLYKFNIKEIIIISDESSDMTNNIVRSFSKQDKRIKLISSNIRKGKSFAVNKFIKIAQCKILLLENADTIPDYEVIELLCEPLLNKYIGATCARPVPIDSDENFMGFAVNLLWKMHHHLSLLQPKFGETIAFKKVIDGIPIVNCDEEMIACLIKKKGFELKYVPRAIVFNKGPDTIGDFLKQRIRIFSGHLYLKFKYGHTVSTFNVIRLINILFSNLNKDKLFYTLVAVCLEIVCRIFGFISFLLNKDYIIWEISKSTKSLKIDD